MPRSLLSRSASALEHFKFDRVHTIKLRSNATQAYARFAADCGIRCNQSYSAMNDSIHTGITLGRRFPGLDQRFADGNLFVIEGR